MTSIDKIKAAKESEEIMSEDVKPRQWTLVFDDDEEIGHIRTLANYSKKNRHEEHVNVIELEPTLQLMEEMAEAIINEARLDSKDEVLEKYRKFKESLK